MYGDPMATDQQIEHDPTNDNVTESVVVVADKSEWLNKNWDASSLK